MDKNIWQNLQFIDGRKTEIPCPSCDRGLLITKKKNIEYIERGSSKRGYDDKEWETYWIDYRFTSLMICNNSNCEEAVAVVGRGGVDEDYDSERHNMKFNAIFVPEFFSPPLKIIPLKEEYPEIIRDLLTESFSLFFSDNSACANKIRLMVEELLTIKKIKRTTINSKKRRVSIALHSRIEMFKKLNDENKIIGDNLMAIKWLGNEGSHSNKIKRRQLIDAYIIAEHSLNEIFINENKKIRKITKRINKRKGRA